MDSGRATLAETRAALERLGSKYEPVTAGELAEELGCNRRAASEKLDELVEQDDVESKCFGEGVRVWWPAERGEAEEQLRRERDQTEQILEISPVAIWVRDGERNAVLANQRAQDILGVPEQELWTGTESTVEGHIYDADGESRTLDELPSAQVHETGEPVLNEEILIEKPNGDRTWLSVNAAPVFGPDGDVERVITTGEDITELKERERDLETELSEILGRVSDAFYALDEEYRFTHVNEQAEKLLQRSEEELLGENLWETFPEAAEIDAVWNSFHTAMETQESTSYELYFDVLDFWVEANIYPSKSGVSVYFRDITERVERERELRESERRYRTLAENFPNGVVTLFDEDRQHTVAAGQAFDFLDVSPDDLEGRRSQEVFDDEEMAATVDAALEAALDGSRESVEITYAGREWILYAVPITDEDGGISMGMTMALDITERKEHEKRLERFASVISHGLRNPLSIAQMYLDMARDEGDPDDFAQVEQALNRMETIIENLLTTTRRGQTLSETEPISLAAASKTAWQNVKTDAATLRVDESGGTVVTSESHLQTVLESLFRNAVDHGEDDVDVRVGNLADGFYVEDTGPGIPPESRDEVFEYGYTSGSGTGIGLAVVQDIVNVHGWDISVTDGTSGGARFEVRGVEGDSSGSTR